MVIGKRDQMIDALRAEAEAIATGNDVERIPDAVDLLKLLDKRDRE